MHEERKIKISNNNTHTQKTIRNVMKMFTSSYFARMSKTNTKMKKKKRKKYIAATVKMCWGLASDYRYWLHAHTVILCAFPLFFSPK